MAALKFLFLFFFIGMALAHQTTLDELKDIVKSCQKTYPVSDKELTDLQKNICPPQADRLLKCFARCYMEKADMMNDKGFNVDKIYEIIMLKHKDHIKQDPLAAVKECSKKRTEHNSCDKAYAAFKCVSDKKLW